MGILEIIALALKAGQFVADYFKKPDSGPSSTIPQDVLDASEANITALRMIDAISRGGKPAPADEARLNELVESSLSDLQNEAKRRADQG